MEHAPEMEVYGNAWRELFICLGIRPTLDRRRFSFIRVYIDLDQLAGLVLDLHG
jgi:hypothetical protein